MPSPLSVKVIPLGRAPVSVSVAVGEEFVVTVKVPGWPAWNTVDGFEVICSGATSTVNLVAADTPW